MDEEYLRKHLQKEFDKVERTITHGMMNRLGEDYWEGYKSGLKYCINIIEQELDRDYEMRALHNQD